MKVEDLILLAKQEGKSQADEKHPVIDPLPSNAMKDIVEKNAEKKFLNAQFLSAFLQGAIFGHGEAMRDKSPLKAFLEFNAQREEAIRNNGLIYESELPTNMSDESYSNWFKKSEVIDGVRMGPKLLSATCINER